MRTRMLRLAGMALALSVMAAGCSDLPTGSTALADSVAASATFSIEGVSFEALGQGEVLSPVILNVRGEALDPAGLTLVWSSDDPSVVAVDEAGRLVARDNGATRIHLRVVSPGPAVVAGRGYLGGVVETSLAVEVYQRVAAVTLPDEAVRFRSVGATRDLAGGLRAVDPLGEPVVRAFTPIWASSDDEVARVSALGEVEAVGDGMTTLTVRVEEQEVALSVLVDATLRVQACAATRIGGLEGASLWRAPSHLGDATAEPGPNGNGCGTLSLVRVAAEAP